MGGTSRTDRGTEAETERNPPLGPGALRRLDTNTINPTKLTYVSEAGETIEYWAKGAQLPKIDGTEVNLNPAKTYDSPFLAMEHGSNKAVISYPGDEDLVLEF